MSVLNGIHAGVRCPSDTLCAVCMGSNFASETMRVGDNGAHFFLGVLRGVRIVAFGHHTTCGAELDAVATILDVFTAFLLNSGHAVGYTLGAVMELGRKKISVTVTAGNSERRSAGENAWAG